MESAKHGVEVLNAFARVLIDILVGNCLGKRKKDFEEMSSDDPVECRDGD